MKIKNVFVLILLVMSLVLLLVLVVWWNKTKNNGSTNHSLPTDTEEVDNDENTEYEVEDDVIQSITDESVDDEDGDVNEKPNQPTDDSQKESSGDANDDMSEIPSEEQQPDTEDPYNLDKDGDGFVDGWY